MRKVFHDLLLVMAERMRGPADGRISDVQMKANIQQKLIESGEMDR